ncbi:helix-turn-helix transcriptional regulator [Desulfogranum marinum]|uniref:helix-turn-helix domain-containing protein n=1 Tax=Desulfogranum marinum TaxID=453220 RepID=UPI0029C7AB17|nr:helix-turn-helix transcriptional regulator [Desulfogranum marinum]
MTKKNGVHIPYPVMGFKIENDWNLLMAWCRYLGLGWQDLAARSHISPLTLSKMEKGDNPLSDDLKHVAFVMGIKPEQLVD